MQELGKALVMLGLGVAVLGLILWSGFGRIWLGRLPGDIHVAREGFSFHFPIVTCLVVSAVLSILAWLMRR